MRNKRRIETTKKQGVKMSKKIWVEELHGWRRELRVGKTTFSVPFFCEESKWVKNEISGRSIELTPEELDVYDFIKGFEVMTTIRFERPTLLSSLVPKKVWDSMLRQYKVAIRWFRVHNNDAWRVLLD